MYYNPVWAAIVAMTRRWPYIESREWAEWSLYGITMSHQLTVLLYVGPIILLENLVRGDWAAAGVGGLIIFLVFFCGRLKRARSGLRSGLRK